MATARYFDDSICANSWLCEACADDVIQRIYPVDFDKSEAGASAHWLDANVQLPDTLRGSPTFDW
eukprot:9887732-Alexandrium_andersonii.AAC.1